MLQMLNSMFGLGGSAVASPHEAVRLINEGVPVVDVREPDEFAAGAVGGAVNVPLGQVGQHGIEALKRAGIDPGEGRVLLVCRSGARSGNACAQLRTVLGERAINLQGGVMAWAAAGLPLYPNGRQDGH